MDTSCLHKLIYFRYGTYITFSERLSQRHIILHLDLQLTEYVNIPSNLELLIQK